MVNTEQIALDKKAGRALAVGILIVPTLMLVMVAVGIIEGTNRLVQSKSLTVLAKDHFVHRASLLLSDNEIYNVSRDFSLRLKRGDEITVNKYMNDRIEVCVLDKCD